MLRHPNEIERYRAQTCEGPRPSANDWIIDQDWDRDSAAELRGLREFEPGEVLPSDRVIARGTGAYHRRKRHGR